MIGLAYFVRSSAKRMLQSMYVHVARTFFSSLLVSSLLFPLSPHSPSAPSLASEILSSDDFPSFFHTFTVSHLASPVTCSTSFIASPFAIFVALPTRTLIILSCSLIVFKAVFGPYAISIGI